MSTAASVETVILCGGRGTRLRELTESIPKVLIEVGGRPILWHIMQIYAHQGFYDFVLALGHMGERIRGYFLPGYAGDAESDRSPSPSAPEGGPTQIPGSRITFVDTGLETNTGGRLKRVEPYLRGDVFFATYGDGVADVDLGRLLEFHREHGRIATVTAVRPRLTFGLLELEGAHKVARFSEKPRLDSWINGGFFVFDRRVFGYLDDKSILEREPMERLARDGELMAYRHEGFWACMDTYKDHAELNMAWDAGRAPWRLWGGE